MSPLVYHMDAESRPALEAMVIAPRSRCGSWRIASCENAHRSTNGIVLVGRSIQLLRISIGILLKISSTALIVAGVKVL